MRLTGAQSQKLHEALLSAFPDESALGIMVRFGLDQNLNAISEGNLSERIFALIAWAEAQGRVLDLLDAACKAVPGNTQLKDTAAEIRGTLAAGGGQAAPFVVPYPRNLLFAGREADLERLGELLEGEAPAIVSGTGGMGKTQLALELAYRGREAGEYPGGIFWLTLEPAEGIAGQVAALAGPKGLNLPGYDPAAFEQNLAGARAALEGPERRLLVFDNLEDPALLDQWRPKGGGSRVLITTRRGAWLRADVAPPLRLKPLERPASLQLLLELRARSEDRAVAELLADPETARHADGICEAVGDLPLALALAASYLVAYPTVTLRDYHEGLLAAPVEYLQEAAALPDPLPGGHEKSIVATFALSYDRLAPEHETDALALKLLHRAAACAPAPIPARLLLRAAGLDPDGTAVPAQAGRALHRLHALGLMENLPEGAQRLHRLVAAFARGRSPDPAADAAAVEQALIREIYAICKAGYPLAGVPHLEHTWQAVAAAKTRMDNDAASLLNNFAYLLERQGDLAAARPLLEEALAIREQALGPNHPDTAGSLNNLAYLLRARGDLAAARPLLERALAIYEQVLGPNHPDTAGSLNNLASLLQAQGELAAARPLLERALAIREQVLGPSHPDTAGSLNNLAGLLQAQGELAAARPLLERALAINEQVLGPNHPDTAGSLNNLASLLRAQGDHAAARLLFEWALAIREQVLGPNHPDTAISVWWSAHLLRTDGNLIAARPLYGRALAIFQQALGPDHPRTRSVQRGLEDLIEALGQASGDGAAEG